MRIDEMWLQIEAATAEELRTGRLRALIATAAVGSGSPVKDDAVDRAVAWVRDYVRHVPVLLSALHDAARSQGVLAQVQPLLDRCEAYWFDRQDLLPDDLGLLGLVDDAYCLLSVVEGVSQWFTKSGHPLYGTSLEPANRTARALLDAYGVEGLDEFVVDALRLFPVSGLLAPSSFARPVIMTDPIWEDRLVEAAQATLDTVMPGEGGASAPPGATSVEDSDLLGVAELRRDAPRDPMITRTHARQSSTRAAARPPARPAAPAPAAPSGGSAGEHTGAFAAAPRAKPPRRPPVSTGFAPWEAPGEYLAGNQPIVPGARYYFWLEVADVPGSIEETPTPLPIERLPANALLTVVLFSPDGGLTPVGGADLGALELRSDRGATVVKVVRQPAKRHASKDQGLLARRLLFPVRATGKPGDCRLRCGIYCRGVLVQSRIIDVRLGGTHRVSHVDYTLASRLAPEQLEPLTEHRFSLYANHRPNGNHDFYIYGADAQGKPYRKSVNIPADTLTGPLALARAGLRRASWGNEDLWSPNGTYRYDRPTLDMLREDLAVLAIAGYRIFDELANELAGGKQHVAELRELVREPGLVQISADADVGMVLPAALIYDYKVSLRTAPIRFKLCAEFERAYRAKTRLLDTACFQGRCPSSGNETTVCPSGFWGFRHALGQPISSVEEGAAREVGLGLRLEYAPVPVLIVGVSRAPDLPHTQAHTAELLALRPDWGTSAWLVEDSLDPLLEAMRSREPHVVYMYCHGGFRPVGEAEIPMLYFGANPEAPKPDEWLEKATLRDNVEWTKPRPLVFLNGCHTTKLDLHTTLNFVKGFVQTANACGVIGTEITVFESLAGAFAARFLKRFLDGAMVGYAVRDARLDLLQEGNPLGLVYTPFVLAGTQLVQAT